MALFLPLKWLPAVNSIIKCTTSTPEWIAVVISVQHVQELAFSLTSL